MKALKTIVAFVPGPALIFVGQWINLLSSTSLANPVWQTAADKIALGVGAILTLFVSIGWVDTPKEVLKRRFFIGCALVLAGSSCAGLFRLRLGPPSPGTKSPNRTRWQDAWETFYIASLSLLAATISVGALSKDKPSRFWLKAVLAIGLAALVIYLIFLR